MLQHLWRERRRTAGKFLTITEAADEDRPDQLCLVTCIFIDHKSLVVFQTPVQSRMSADCNKGVDVEAKAPLWSNHHRKCDVLTD